MQTAAEIELDYNVDVSVIERNVRTNSRRSLPWLKMEEPHEGHAVIVGGGPSINGQIKDLQYRADQGQTFFTVNGANIWFYLKLRRVSDYHVLLDARPENKNFLEYPTRTFLLASQCDQAVFDEAEMSQRPITLWHAHTDNVESWLPEKHPEHTLIASGSTVLLAAITIAYAMGYRKIHVYGADSSFTDAHHAYSQPQNDDDDVIEATVMGRTFKTTPWMAAQAQQFQRVAAELADGGAIITVHGDGLLPWVAQNMSRPLAELEAEKYRVMWSHEAYRKMSPAEEILPWIMEQLPAKTSIVDFGMGTGRAAQKLQDAGHSVIGIDFADNCRDPGITVPLVVANLWDELPDINKEFGICIDVMEHIPTGHVDAVLENIATAAVTTTLFRIDMQPDNMGALIGQPLHLTVENEDWWTAKLRQFWPNVTYHGQGKFVCKHASSN